MPGHLLTVDDMAVLVRSRRAGADFFTGPGQPAAQVAISLNGPDFRIPCHSVG